MYKYICINIYVYIYTYIHTQTHTHTIYPIQNLQQAQGLIRFHELQPNILTLLNKALHIRLKPRDDRRTLRIVRLRI